MVGAKVSFDRGNMMYIIKWREKMRRIKLQSAVLTAVLAFAAAAHPAMGEETQVMTGNLMEVPSAGETVNYDESWLYASASEIHSGQAVLYRAGGSMEAPGRKNFTVCVNAGHGTAGGSNYQTMSHPDGTPKVTGGTNAEGAVYSTAISSGMAFADGTPEASATLMTAMALKEYLLQDGYDVLMIRESDDVQLDNIARTVMANNCADIHIAIHFDSTQSDKGVYFCSVPDVASYRQMEPVASHWQEHMALGQALVQGLEAEGFWLFGDGTLPMDLTQTSYSTIPSVDIEVGDGASDHSQEACAMRARGLKEGVGIYFNGKAQDSTD